MPVNDTPMSVRVITPRRARQCLDMCRLLVIVVCSLGYRTAVAEEFVPKTILSFNDSLAFRSNRYYASTVDIPTVIKQHFTRWSGAGYEHHTFLRDIPDLGEEGIPYEWWPLIPGSYTFPTVDQPELYFAGTVAHSNLSSEDVMFAHPFGLDFNIDAYPINPSSEYRRLVYESTDTSPSVWRPLHIEIEGGLFPHVLWEPRTDDVILVRGAWILDGGHAPFKTEIHPPSFMALARSDGAKTTSFAFANPFRTTQLYNPNESLANDFTNWKRFSDSETHPFPQHIQDEIEKIVLWRSARLEAHALVEPIASGVYDWYVCNTNEHALDAQLMCDHHFTSRSGVTISVTTDPTSGCAHITAVVGPEYSPMKLDRRSLGWHWSDINHYAEMDVLDIILHMKIGLPGSTTLNPGGINTNNPSVKKDPLIDSYDPLRPLSGESVDTEPELTTSDRQPFPFYGWVNVWWKERISIAAFSFLTAEPAELRFELPNDAEDPRAVQTIEVTNVGSGPVTITDVHVAEDASRSFRVERSECGDALPENGKCVIAVRFDPQTWGRLTGKLVISTANNWTTTVRLAGEGLIR